MDPEVLLGEAVASFEGAPESQARASSTSGAIRMPTARRLPFAAGEARPRTACPLPSDSPPPDACRFSRVEMRMTLECAGLKAVLGL